MQKRSALSVIDAEGISRVDCAQDMLYAMHVIEEMGLKVAKPMILETDNRGFCDLANNWAVADRTKYEAVQWNFLRELKEQDALRVNWIPGKKMSMDEDMRMTISKELNSPTGIHVIRPFLV
eukprot:7265317-Ditylum_brightwellii.AAC.1